MDKEQKQQAVTVRTGDTLEGLMRKQGYQNAELYDKDGNREQLNHGVPESQKFTLEEARTFGPQETAGRFETP